MAGDARQFLSLWAKSSTGTLAALARLLRAVLSGLIAAALFMAGNTAAETVPRKIVLVGGTKSQGPARHDYPNGIRLIQKLLESSPDTGGGKGLVVNAYAEGWPLDPAAFDGASTVVWYFDGLDKHPLLDVTRRAQFESMMKRGVGLVALHQASTLPVGDDHIAVQRWLGAARDGMFDRTDEMVALKPASPAHPVSRGVPAFTYFDEFYPTLRFRNSGLGVTPILQGKLHVQARDGKPVIIGAAGVRTVAWAFEREGGGRSFGFTGAHYMAALDEPAIRKMLLNAIFWTADIDVPMQGVRIALPNTATTIAHANIWSAAPPSLDAATFHRNPQRTGWSPLERELTPASVGSPAFGPLWESPQFDMLDGQPPRMYASPLYLDKVTLSAGEYRGGTFAVLFAATSNGFVYAVNAFKKDGVMPGTILWRTQLAAPCRYQPVLLDGIATGVLSTPVIDVRRKRFYVTSCDPEKRWQVYALDVTSGQILSDWPLMLDEATFNAVNRNPGSGAPIAPKRFDYRVQRGALNLSPDGGHLYITFGESSTGWIVAVNTTTVRITSAFASVADPHRSSGGIWGPGGPAVDTNGNIFVVTGTGFNGYVEHAHNWAQSVLKIEHSPSSGFTLRGTYTPFNYCDTAKMDIDLGSGGPLLLPDLDVSMTATSQLLTVGGKQGNVYLIDRARMPGRLNQRQSCSTDASSDQSLLPPEVQPQFGKRGPLNVFGIYSESDAAIDTARSRSVAAYFQDGHANAYLFVTGTSRMEPATPSGMSPSLVRLKVIAERGKPAYLRVDQLEQTQVFENPGSPVVSSNGERDAIVWVLDTNTRRSAPLAGEGAPQPVLYAFDALTLKLLWKSQPGALYTSGKYNESVIAHGAVFVGTDRIQAFGLRDNGPAAVTINDGKAIYAQRCAMCHEQPEGRVPPRELIASRSGNYIVDALTNGAMRAQSAGLSAAEIDAVANFLRQSVP